MGNPGDMPPPTPEMLAIEPSLKRLISPVTQELLDLGVGNNMAGFAALRIVWVLMKGIVDEGLDIPFVLDHASHKTGGG
jgi:hypothetical protein